MKMLTTCDRCKKEVNSYLVAALNIGSTHRVSRLCLPCTTVVEVAIVNALNPMGPSVTHLTDEASEFEQLSAYLAPRMRDGETLVECVRRLVP